MKGKEAVCSDCSNTEFELRRRVIGNGGIQFVYQCLRCGRAVSNAVPKTAIRNVDGVRPWDLTLAQRYEESQHSARAAERAAWFREHNIYLKSPQWGERRAAVLARAKGVCEGCARARATQVHHLTYEHWQQEFLWELVAICDECHERIHPHMNSEGQS